MNKRIIASILIAALSVSTLFGVSSSIAAEEALAAGNDLINGIKLSSESYSGDSEGIIINVKESAKDISGIDSLVFEIQSSNENNYIYPFVIAGGYYFEYCGASLANTFQYRASNMLSRLDNVGFTTVGGWSRIIPGTAKGVMYYEVPLTSFACRGKVSGFGAEATESVSNGDLLSAYKDNSGFTVSAVGVRMKSGNSADISVIIGNVYEKKSADLNKVCDMKGIAKAEYCTVNENTYFQVALNGWNNGLLVKKDSYDIQAVEITDVEEVMPGYFNGINMKEYDIVNGDSGYLNMNFGTYENSMAGKTLVMEYYDRGGDGCHFDLKLKKDGTSYAINGADIYFINYDYSFRSKAKSGWSVVPPSGFVGYICIPTDSITTEAWNNLADKTGVSINLGIASGWSEGKWYDFDLGKISIYEGDIRTVNSKVYKQAIDSAQVFCDCQEAGSPDSISRDIAFGGTLKNVWVLKETDDSLAAGYTAPDPADMYYWYTAPKLTPVSSITEPAADAAWLLENRNFLIAGGFAITGDRMWASIGTGGKTEPDPDNMNAILYSDDGGTTWIDPAFIVEWEVDDSQAIIPKSGATLWTDPLGRLWIFISQAPYPQTSGPYCQTNFAFVIKNPEADPSEFEIEEKGFLWNGYMPTAPTVIENENGEEEWLAVSNCGWTEYTDIYSSRDQGATWLYKSSARGTINGGHESRIVQLTDGSLMFFKRIDEGEKGGLERTYSYDYGRTWTEFESDLAWPLRGPGTRTYLYKLKSGHLAFVSVDHEYTGNVETSRVNMTVHLSEDDGKTWTSSLLLDERYVSEPTIVQDDEGWIYISYDSGRVTRCEMRYARIKEEDIKAGAFVSEGSVKKGIITKGLAYEEIVSWTASPGIQTEFAYGTEYSAVLEKLGTKLTVTTNQKNEYEISGTWECVDYKNTEGEYLFIFTPTDLGSKIEDTYSLLRTTIRILPFTENDINGDGALDVRDLVHMKRYLDNPQSVTIHPEAISDLDGNGVVDETDLALLRKKLVSGI